jgi:hypothetical protein
MLEQWLYYGGPGLLVGFREVARAGEVQIVFNRPRPKLDSHGLKITSILIWKKECRSAPIIFCYQPQPVTAFTGFGWINWVARQKPLAVLCCEIIEFPVFIAQASPLSLQV